MLTPATRAVCRALKWQPGSQNARALPALLSARPSGANRLCHGPAGTVPAARRLHSSPRRAQQTEELSKQPRDNEDAETTTVAAPADNPLFWPYMEQQEGWRPMVKAVKDKGATFFLQLWHVGRASHNEFQPGGQAPVGPSAIRITDGTQVFSLKQGKMVDFPTPRALEAHEIPGIVDTYRRAARSALDVGFDGVEIHGANGYLIDAFLKDEANQRTDQYGGSIENRCRFALEVVDAVCAEVGEERVGMRLSPFGGFQNATDSHPYSLVTYLLEELGRRHPSLSYLHFVEPRAANQAGGRWVIRETQDSLEPFRKVWKGPMIAAGGFKRESGMHAVQSGHSDLVAYGRWFLANPDLPQRFCLDAPLNKYHRDTFYTQGDEGYIDYPTLAETEYGEEYLHRHPCAADQP